MLRDQLEHLLRDKLVTEQRIVAAWLFGSRARDQGRAGSDVDIAVLYATAPPVTATLDLASELTAVIGIDVDVVDVALAPADLVHRVLRDGRLLLERDRPRRLQFEVDVRNRYFDMTPIWLQYRRVAKVAP